MENAPNLYRGFGVTKTSNGKHSQLAMRLLASKAFAYVGSVLSLMFISYSLHTS
jgi:hypothetical protein